MDFYLQPHRRQRLTDFVEGLSSYERRALSQILQQQTFQRDIVSCVPTELAEVIFRNLDFTHLFVCRRVCRSWLNILKRAALEKSVITDQCYLSAAVPSGSSAFVERAAQIQRFRTGRPVSVHQWEMPHGVDEDASRDIAFNASRFAVAIEDEHENVTGVEIWDFATGSKSQVSSPGLHHIYDWTLSESALFFVTYTGFLHAKLLGSSHTPPLISFRMPGVTSHLWSRGAIVAFQSGAGIGVWRPSTNVVTVIPVTHPFDGPSFDALLVSESGDRVSAFNFSQPGSGSAAVLHLQTYLVASKCLVSQCSINLPDAPTWHSHYYPDEISFSPSHDLYGYCGILSTIEETPLGVRRKIVFFNQQTQTIFCRNYALAHFVPEGGLEEPLNKEFFCWNGIAYSVRFDSDCCHERAKSRPALLVETYNEPTNVLLDGPHTLSPNDSLALPSTHRVIEGAQLCRIRTSRWLGMHRDDVFISGDESHVIVHQKRDGGHDMMTLLSFGTPAKIPSGTVLIT